MQLGLTVRRVPSDSIQFGIAVMKHEFMFRTLHLPLQQRQEIMAINDSVMETSCNVLQLLAYLVCLISSLGGQNSKRHYSMY